MPIETLTERRLNRALLARQLLLERSNSPLPTVLEQVAGLQTQYAPSAYIGLWTRMSALKRGDLTSALVDGSAVQATLMRTTIHTVSAGDFWPFALAIRDSRREWLTRRNRRQLAGVDIKAVAAATRKLLKSGPLKMSELTSQLEARGIDVPVGWIGLWVDLVRVPPSGTWESRRADVYGLAEEMISPPMRKVTAAEATDHLVRRYLGAFGPAHTADIATWAMLPATDVHAATERIGVVLYRDEKGKKLIDLPGTPMPEEDTVAPVRFLPTWDATLLVHARRTMILPEKYRRLIFNTKMPQSIGTFLVDGRVAGTWRFKENVEFELFEPLSKPVLRQVKQEAERLTEFQS